MSELDRIPFIDSVDNCCIILMKILASLASYTLEIQNRLFFRFIIIFIITKIIPKIITKFPEALQGCACVCVCVYVLTFTVVHPSLYVVCCAALYFLVQYKASALHRESFHKFPF